MTHPGPRIVALDGSSAGELLTLQRAAYVSEAAAHHDFALPPLAQTLQQVGAELADPHVVVLGVHEGGRLVGSIRLRRTGRVVDVARLMVAPDRQGHGIGRTLLAAAETTFPHIDTVRLFTGEHSIANLRLYARAGYRETERTRAGDYDLVHFVKDLTGNAPTADPRGGGSTPSATAAGSTPPVDAGLDQVRIAIDGIDRQIVELIAQRQRWVIAAGRLTADEHAVRDPDRVRQVLDRVRALATGQGASGEVVARTYQALIAAFIDLELERSSAL